MSQVLGFCLTFGCLHQFTEVNCYAIPDIVGSRIGSVPSTTHSELAALVATLQISVVVIGARHAQHLHGRGDLLGGLRKENACWGNLCAIQGPISRQSIVIKSREVPGQAVAKANSLEDVTLKEGPGRLACRSTGELKTLLT